MVTIAMHDYGDLCQAVTELAAERSAKISADEFQTYLGALLTYLITASINK